MNAFIPVAAAVLLASCAGTSSSGGPRFAEQMDPAWTGVMDSTQQVGVLLVERPGVYSRAGFEALASTDDALRPVVPGLRWTPVDSSHPLLANLKGWDLDSLSLTLLADSMVWKLPYAQYGEELVLRQAGLAESTRSALRRVGAALGVQTLIALRMGERVPLPLAASKPLSAAEQERRRVAAASGQVLSAVGDSSKSHEDAIWFGVFDLRSGALWYSRDFQATGAMSTTSSAEGAWARSGWEAFASALKALPERRARALAAEPR